MSDAHIPQVVASQRIKIDDSYEHEVFQQSDRRRVVFVLDVPHLQLRPEEFAFQQELMSYTTGVGLPRAQ